jgi:alpha-ketoglutarate-dependent taurine dioxygenase
MTLVDTNEIAQANGLTVRHLSAAIGSTIEGVDVRDASDEQIAAIRQIWLDRKVVFLPGQHLDPAEHVAFALRFGAITEGHPVVPGLKEEPRVFEIDYTTAGKLYETYGDVSSRGRAVDWHTDVTYVKRPPLGSILNAVVIPSSGGDTLFSNQVAAYNALSESLRSYLLTLTAVHDGKRQFQGLLNAVGQGRWEGKTFDRLEPSEHPVVRTHPETGERALFVNPGFTKRIVQLSADESAHLLAFLYAHSVHPEFTVRYHWSTGDLGFWDNRATQHAVVGDFGRDHRVIQRVTLRGDEPVLEL